jgi:cytochrome c-type biogenesis protein CcmH/NrfG
VSHAPWTGSFADARNVAIERASGDWILMLDADQRVEATSWDELRRLLHVELPTAYLLRQWNYTEPHGDDAYVEHLIVRLFPNRPEIRYEGAVHEQVVCRDPTLGFQVGRSGVVLHHDGYRPQYRNAASKAARDRIALEQAVRDAPDDGFAVYNLGMTYRSLGLQDEAAGALRRSIELGVSGRRTPEPPGYVLHARIELGRAYGALGQANEAIGLLEAAVRAGPDSPDAWAGLGAAYAMAGRWSDALEAYRSVQSCPEAPAAAPTDRTLIAWQGAVGEAQMLRMLGRVDEAAAVLVELVTRGHDHLGVVVTLAEVRRDQGDIEGAVELLESVGGHGSALPGVRALLDELVARRGGEGTAVTAP